MSDGLLRTWGIRHLDHESAIEPWRVECEGRPVIYLRTEAEAVAVCQALNAVAISGDLPADEI